MFARTYFFKLKQNVNYISQCSGIFELNGNGNTKLQIANNDSFKLDLKNNIVIWSDNKGTTKSKIYKLIEGTVHNHNRLMFITECNVYRITMTHNHQAVIEIMFQENGWYLVSYLCDFRYIK
jgi:hypothetical protein